METQNSDQQDRKEILRILKSIEKLMKEAAEPKVTWYDTQKICQLRGTTRRTIETWRNAGMIPFSKMGGKVYYRLSDIENYLTDHMTYKEQKP